MRMSKQERIAIIIFSVVIVCFLGTLFFIMPAITKIQTSEANLDTARKDYKEMYDKQSSAGQLKEDIVKLYEEGGDIADMFFEDLEPYQADQEIRKFLAQLEDKVVVESLNVSEYTTYDLSAVFTDPEEVTYPIKENAIQGFEDEESIREAKELREKYKNFLSGVETVGSITVTFDVEIEPDKVDSFIDSINDYWVDKTNDNGEVVKVRKALYLTEYHTLVEKTVGKDEDETTAAAATGENGETIGENDSEEEAPTFSATINLFCIKRIKDPAELDGMADDAIVPVNEVVVN